MPSDQLMLQDSSSNAYAGDCIHYTIEGRVDLRSLEAPARKIRTLATIKLLLRASARELNSRAVCGGAIRTTPIEVFCPNPPSISKGVGADIAIVCLRLTF